MEFITGEKILERKAWGIVAKLIEAYGLGLSPYREFDGARMTFISKCFNCTKANPDYKYKPGRPVESNGKCRPALLSDRPNIDVMPSSVPTGLALPLSPLELAMKIDPALVDYFFDEGELVFQSGVFAKHVHQWAALFLTGALGSSIAEHLMIEETCSNFDRIGTLDMEDRLKSAKFKLKEVKRYEHLHRIREFETDQEENASLPEEWPTTPLDFGKALLAKDEYTRNPAERIRLMEKRFPNLNSAAIGAYARGYPPDPNNDGACKRWYQRNKSK